MALVTVAELLLKLLLMHRQQPRKKASRPISWSVSNRTPGRSTRYLQTRIRGPRLPNAARILVIVELTHRLHQAYADAYDKQAADRLLPQNPVPQPHPSPTPQNQSQPSKPPCVHVGSGQADINFGRSRGGPVSSTGGLLLTANKVHIYGGLSSGVGLPRNYSSSIMVGNGNEVSTGLTYAFAAGAIMGFSYSGKLNLSSFRSIGSSLKNGSFMFGGTTPGVGASVAYVSRGFRIPCL